MPNETEACHRSEGGTAPRPWVRTPAIASEDEIASPPGSCHRPTDSAPAPGKVGLRRDRGMSASCRASLTLTLGEDEPCPTPTIRPSGRATGAMPLRGLDWLVISGPISEGFALRIAGLCFLGPPVDHGDGPACYRRRPEIARRTRRRTLVIQRHGRVRASRPRGRFRRYVLSEGGHLTKRTIKHAHAVGCPVELGEVGLRPPSNRSENAPHRTRWGRQPVIRLKDTPNGQGERSSVSLALPGVESSGLNVLYRPFREVTP